jgi:cytochrome c556
MKRIMIAIVSVSASFGCGRTSEPPAANVPPEAQWLLAGSNDERFARVAKQLRGFDVAMVEVGYRYEALYWAGKDANWGFADYQAKKIRTAIENGLERRPKRAPSAKMFDGPLAATEKAITASDAAAFASAFDTLTATCNACHQAERVPFITIAPPTVRASPVRPAASADGAK